MTLDGRSLTLTNLDKPLWPEDELTKADLIRYYLKAAPYLLPHLAGRPLSITRHPDGIHGESFYQKNTPAYAPAWIARFPVFGDGHTTEYPLCEERATLVWLANQAAIGLHPWLSTVAHPDRPDLMVIDLDPAEGATFDQVRQVAHLIHTCLQALGLKGYPKLSGATGLHIYVPIAPCYPYSTVSQLAGQIGALVVQAVPGTATNERRVRDRTGRVYIDHLQNLPGKTIAAPFSVRPLPRAPLSMPIAWDEIDRFEPDAFRLAELLGGPIDGVLANRAPLFAPVLELRQNLTPALEHFGLEESACVTGPPNN